MPGSETTHNVVNTYSAPPAPNGVAVPAVRPIPIGPRTRQQMAALLEQHLGAVWVALLENNGAAQGQGYALVIESASLMPVEASGSDAPRSDR